MANTEQVFVYGTLRPPQAETPPEDSRYYFEVEKLIKSVEPAELKAAQMFDLGSYPGATRGGGVVVGDLLTVSAGALPILDRIEGHPTFFKRERARVQAGEGIIRAWVYWAPRGLTLGRCPIPGGDWFARSRTDNDDCADDSIAANAVDETLRVQVQRFARAECSWFSSVRPDGRAHSAPVWHVWYRGRAYVVTPGGSVKAANISRNPGVVIAHQDPLNPVIIEGWGTLAKGMRSRLQPLFKEKYDWDLSTDDEYDTIIEITPLKLLTWGEHGQGRWPGEEVQRVWAVL
jgi:gamma-glutamylcyclotransferase (GGCT)/AIG2-like uncharacterized protein YtfP